MRAPPSLPFVVLALLFGPNGCGGSVWRADDEFEDVGSGGFGTGGFNCLAEGTLISTPSGSIPIERLRPGQLVYSFNHATGEVESDRIVAIQSAEDAIGNLHVSASSTLRLTAQHPVFDFATGNYRKSGDWQHEEGVFLEATPGWEAPPSLRTPEGFSVASGQRARFVPTSERARVFDLTVQNNHNLFAEGVLVHNKSLPSGGSAPYTGGSGVGGDSQCFATQGIVCPESDRGFFFGHTSFSIFNSAEEGPGGAAGSGSAAGEVLEISFPSDDCLFPVGSTLRLWAEPGLSYEIWQSDTTACSKDVLLQDGLLGETAIASFVIPSNSHITVRVDVAPADCVILLDPDGTAPEGSAPTSLCPTF